MPRGIPRNGINKGCFKPGHIMVRTPLHAQRISEALKMAWLIKRKRKPIGTTNIDCNGYVRVKVVEGKGYWVPQHVLVAEKILGRPLRNGEIVHHINGNRSDNKPANLFVCRNRSHHNQVHGSQDAALRVLLEAGKVVFKDGTYQAIL